LGIIPLGTHLGEGPEGHLAIQIPRQSRMSIHPFILLCVECFITYNHLM
jgi:hypothetical protein